MKIASFLLFAASEAYPPTDIENPGESKTCANEVAEDDCVRLFVAKNYSCESFTKEQQKACQGKIRFSFFFYFYYFQLTEFKFVPKMFQITG